MLVSTVLFATLSGLAAWSSHKLYRREHAETARLTSMLFGMVAALFLVGFHLEVEHKQLIRWRAAVFAAVCWPAPIPQLTGPAMLAGRRNPPALPSAHRSRRPSISDGPPPAPSRSEPRA